MAAKAQIRTEFRQNAGLTDTKSIQEAVTKAEDVAKFLRENLVQGKKQNGQDHTYGMLLATLTLFGGIPSN